MSSEGRLARVFIALFLVVCINCGVFAATDVLRNSTVFDRRSYREVRGGVDRHLGRSFRVFVNQAAYQWIAGETPQADGAVFVKMNLVDGVAVEVGDWSIARAEVARNDHGSWRFYSFGPAGDLAATAASLAEEKCLACHQQVRFRGQPLFTRMYIPASYYTQRSFRLSSEQATLRTELLVDGRRLRPAQRVTR